jgi:ankyrin repeat protein
VRETSIYPDLFCCLIICNRFRWVFCQLEVLRYSFPNNLRRILEELPKSLDDTYKRILREINNANQVLAYRLLQCLTVASRPLRVEELAEVLAFDLSTGGIPKLNEDWRWENEEEAVLSACSSLVSVIIEDGFRVVQFSHFSVKEFLTSDRLASCAEESRFYIPVEDSHMILAQACLGVLLSLDDSTDGYGPWNLPLYQYATSYWVGHAQVGKVELEIKDTLDCFFDMDKLHFSAWIRSEQSLGWELSSCSEDEDTDVPPSAAPLYFAAWRGFHGLVKRLLIKHPEQVHHLGGEYGTPLHASVSGGNIEIAQLLVACGADVNSLSALNLTPLHIASQMGHLNVVKWLLNHGVDMNAQDGMRGLTPLHFSASCGHIDVCRVLLEHGAVVNAQGNTGSTPILEACKSRCMDIIWLLLDHNPDVNVRDSEDGQDTPLHHAARQGLLKFAEKLVLELNAEVNSCNQHKSTPLLLASQYGHTDVVRLLLDHNADVYAHDDDGDTSLHESAGYGHLEITQMLLNRKAEVNFQNKNGSTPLLRASGDQYSGTLNLEVVQLLLDHGADVHVRNERGWTASEVAFHREWHEIVRLLSQHAAE